MKIQSISIKNFRRLESVGIDVEDKETIFVGPNNSGKTSATAVFRCFLGDRDFKIHDFSVARIADIDRFGNTHAHVILPTIELDIWFSIDTNSIAFGRAFYLLPRLSEDFERLGIRLKYEAREADKMFADYTAAYPTDENGNRSHTLSQFLAIDNNLNRYYEITYYSLEESEEQITEAMLDTKAGKRLLHGLVRIDFVDAQRNIDDDEMSRSTRLSAAFAAFYRRHLEQADAEEGAYRIIDENNQKLTDHYKEHFGGLMTVISGLGVPSLNDRELKIVSTLSPETALRGNTNLLYVDSSKNHELPELYNGLGFKNLIYIAIQVSHFHLQWMRTEKSRPLCQLIFIEEPEVHLHAQVQQTFIENIWKIVADAAKAEKEEEAVPQLVVTTHSSHILDAVEFANVRYFQRCALSGEDPKTVKIFNASRVHSLRAFQPEPVEVNGNEVDETSTLAFLQKYLKLTHCDLFFADAAILVEGTVEKLLLPKMVEKTSPGLSSKYLTFLEVGGAYAHRFSGLLEFLQIPYLIITDIDSVEAEGHHTVCRGDTTGALTSNASLKGLLGVNTIDELTEVSTKKEDASDDRFVAYQGKIDLEENGQKCTAIPRTLEEAFILQNLSLFRAGHVDIGIDLPEPPSDTYEEVYKRVKSPAFKKTEFALNVLATDQTWETPEYIAEGLKWLEARLSGADNGLEK